MNTIPALIHIDPARGPVGVWRVIDGTLHSHYPHDPVNAYTSRALDALHARGNDVPWDVWFDQLADRTPYFDDYLVVPTDPTETLETVYAWVVQLWDNTP